MTINYELHEGSQAYRPPEIDDFSSKTAVYLRRNIRQVTREDPMTGETTELWQYDEAKLTPTEYVAYKTEQNRANIEYIAMMTDVDL